MAGIPRYYAAACQTDLPCPRDRSEIAGRVGHLLGMVDRAVVGYAPFFDVKLVVFPEFAHAAPIYETVEELRRPPGRPDPQRADRPLRPQGQGARRLHPDGHLPRSRSPVAGLGLQHDLPDRPRRAPVPISQGQSLAPLGGPREPARPARLRRAALPRGRDRDRQPRRGHLLRLALPGGDAGPGPGGRGGPDPRLGLHGPLGRDPADGLVDPLQSGRGPSRISRTSSRRTRGRAPRIIRRSPGRAGAWSSTSTAASSPRPTPAPARRSSSGPIDIAALRRAVAGGAGITMLSHLRTEAYSDLYARPIYRPGR